ncbi:MAG: hypothetical protein JWP69_551 [Flaviaesturariibacter sp.]|nr:hypothetical protein [Flaviaesturariibacter sp.]
MGKFKDSDLQEYQKENEGSADSSSKIAAAGHQARDDMQEDGGMPERQETKIDAGYEKLADDAVKGGNSSK